MRARGERERAELARFAIIEGERINRPGRTGLSMPRERYVIGVDYAVV